MPVEFARSNAIEYYALSNSLTIFSILVANKLASKDE